MSLTLIDTDRAFGWERSRALERGEIHLWRLPLLRAQDAIDAENWWLDASEREQARSFLFAQDRLLYVSAHAWLRRILATYLRHVHPASVRCERRPGGKPQLEAAFQKLPVKLHFSLAHTHSAILIGLTMVGEIGVDIERMQAKSGLEHMYPSVLHEDEHEALLRMPADERAVAFYRLWAIKEAYTKALGTGLLHPFHSVAVELRGTSSFTLRDSSQRLRVVRPLTGHAAFASTAEGASYAMAAAVLGNAGDVVMHAVRGDVHLGASLVSSFASADADRMTDQ